MEIKKLAVYAPGPYSGGELFNPASRLNRDDCLAGFHELKSALEAAGGECRTFDGCEADGAVPDAVLFLDIPPRPVRRLLGGWHDKVLKCALLQEPEIICPRNWEPGLQKQFDRLITWNDALVDGKRYFKFNYANVLPAAIEKDLRKKDGLCAMVAGNRKSRHPLELYSGREEAIRWFEKNHPEDFDLYGRGWDEYLFQGSVAARALNRVRPLKRLLAPRFPSYRGAVPNKREVLARHRFAICYENSCGMQGYISEKIFDCFSAGCVPVYRGAENIQDHVPAGCFLDKREFPGYEQLYSRMKTMTDAEYLARLDAIETFLNSAAGRLFSAGAFAQSILKALS